MKRTLVSRVVYGDNPTTPVVDEDSTLIIRVVGLLSDAHVDKVTIEQSIFEEPVAYWYIECHCDLVDNNWHQVGCGMYSIAAPNPLPIAVFEPVAAMANEDLTSVLICTPDEDLVC